MDAPSRAVGVDIAVNATTQGDVQFALWHLSSQILGCTESGTFLNWTFLREVAASDDNWGYGNDWWNPTIMNANISENERYYIQLDGYGGTVSKGIVHLSFINHRGEPLRRLFSEPSSDD